MEQGMEDEVPALNWLQQGKMRKRYEEVHIRIHGKGQRAALHKDGLEIAGKDQVI